jgi:uncharacterized protein YprB with RNaseH-like and TPR domain
LPIAPVWRLKLAEIRWLGTHRCKHKHTYIEHYNCFGDENPQKLRYGYFDIETFGSNFAADRGFVLCYCILDKRTNVITERVITKKEIFTELDKPLIKQLIIDLKGFDKIYTWYGAKFDVPYVRGRALKHKLKFIEYGERFHKDLYFVGRAKVAYASRSLENMAKQLLGKTRKTRFDYDHWLQAALGDEKYLKKILDHCRFDVMDLKDIHRKLDPYYKETDASY